MPTSKELGYFDLEYYIDASGLLAAVLAADALKMAFNAEPAYVIGERMLKESAKVFDEFVFADAASNPKQFWHMFKANRVGVPGAQLWKTSVIKGGRGGKDLKLDVQFLPNTEEIKVGQKGYGTLSGYEREGVRLPSGNSSLGVRSTVKFKQRSKAFRARDYRDRGKTYSWPTQVLDVEFGKRLTITPHKTGRSNTYTSRKGKTRSGAKKQYWLAIPTRGQGMVFATSRTIDYSTWPSYGAFTRTFEQYFGNEGPQFERRLQKIVNGKVSEIETIVAKKINKYKAVPSKKVGTNISIGRPHPGIEPDMRAAFKQSLKR